MARAVRSLARPRSTSRTDPTGSPARSSNLRIEPWRFRSAALMSSLWGAIADMSSTRNISSSDADTNDANEDGQAQSSKEAFGKRLRDLVDQTGLSDAKVARRCGMSTSGFNRYTKGLGLPGAAQLFAIADALDVSARWLIFGHHDEAGSDELSAEHRLLLDSFSRLSVREREAVMDLVTKLAGFSPTMQQIMEPSTLHTRRFDFSGGPTRDE